MRKAHAMIAAAAAAALTCGLAGSPAAFATTATAPGAPTGLRVVPGNTTVTLSWTAPGDGGSAITGYNVFEGTSSGGENYSKPVNGSTLITVTTATVTGLSNGKTYYFTVEADNAIGASAASNEAWAIPAATVPGAPTTVSAVGGYESATITWNSPASAGGSNITQYTVTASDATLASRGGQTCVSTTGSLSCTLNGLTDGDSYSFTVTATNSLGTSVASAPSNTVVPAVSVPEAPTGLVATPGGTSVTLAWAAPPNGGDAIEGYNVYEGTSSGGENYSKPVNGSTLLTATGTTVESLTTGAEYYFTVKAVNAVGLSAASAEVFAVVGGSVPDAPRSVTAAAEWGAAEVSWIAPTSPGGSAVTGYTVTATDSTVAARGGQKCTWTSGPLDCVVGGLTDGDYYTFTVTATNSVGTSDASSASAAVVPKITAPSAPSGLSAVPSFDSVVLTWTPPASYNGAVIEGYNLYEGTSSGGENYGAPVNGGVLLTGTSATLNGLTNGKTYYFTVKAVNAVGASPASNEVWAVPAATVAAAPVSVYVAYGLDNSLVVGWTPPLNSGGSAITGYVVTPYIGSSAQPARVFDTTTTTETITGLTPGASYSFTVASINASGTGAPSGPSAVAVLPKETSRTSFVISERKITYGDEQAEELYVTVAPQYPGFTPTGTITFSGSSCRITLSGGKGSCKLSAKSLAVGTHILRASYSGSSAFDGSASGKDVFTVYRVKTTTTLKLSSKSLIYGEEQSEHLSVTVTAKTPGVTPTGTVTVGSLCRISLSGGKGSCSFSAKKLSVGSHRLAASYAGGSTFVGSTSSSQTVSVKA